MGDPIELVVVAAIGVGIYAAGAISGAWLVFRLMMALRDE